MGPLYLLGAGLLALLAAFTLASSMWSDAPARALLEYDRALLYLLAFVLFGSLGRSEARLRWLVRGVGLGLLAVCVCAFITRALPDVWPTEPNISNDRLSYPLTYWNALGIMAAVGVVLGFGLSSDGREHPAVRVLAAAALPVLAATLLFTFSRGAMAAGAAGLLAVVLVARSPAVLSGLVSAVPAGFAVSAAYGAELLATERPTTQAAVAQGHDVALVVAVCTVAAGAVRALLVLADRRFARLRTPTWLQGPVAAVAGVVTVLAAAIAVALAAGAPEAVSRQYDRFVQGDVIRSGGDQRSRLTDPGNNGRLDQWRVAVDESRSERVHGLGAGTYTLMWDRARPEAYEVEDAHSLYVEMLAELGIVGLVLVSGALVVILGACLLRARGPDRGVYAALFGGGLAWALHAGIDWDWEMPATGVWLFAAGGLALAARKNRLPSGAGDPPNTLRIVAGLAVLLVTVTPARVFLSERPLRDAAQAFSRGDCPRAIDRSLDSVSMLASRAEPFAIIGFCDVRLGYPDLAIRAMENALARDPLNWEYHYSLALVRGAAGRDPRPAARRALALNPRSTLARTAVRRFATPNAEAWRRRALSARLPVD